MEESAYPRPFADLRTLPAAVRYLDAAFAAQQERAVAESAEPNASVAGDARVRDAFWALLPPDEQRRFFLRVAGDRKFWPRLRSLVGAPPYSFLRPEDEGMLRASGICKGRVNMAHSEPTATNYGEFGKGHYEDAAGRLYRMIAKENASREELPWAGLAPGVRIVADVRVQRRSAAVKSAIAKGEHGTAAMASLVFPRVGDTLALRLVPSLRGSGDDGGTMRAHVSLGRQKAPASPVARLVLRVE